MPKGETELHSIRLNVPVSSIFSCKSIVVTEESHTDQSAYHFHILVHATNASRYTFSRKSGKRIRRSLTRCLYWEMLLRSTRLWNQRGRGEPIDRNLVHASRARNTRRERQKEQHGVEQTGVPTSEQHAQEQAQQPQKEQSTESPRQWTEHNLQLLHSLVSDFNDELQYQRKQIQSLNKRLHYLEEEGKADTANNQPGQASQFRRADWKRQQIKVGSLSTIILVGRGTTGT